MPTVLELLRDPKFRRLSQEAQIFGLRRIDPQFGDLSLDAQLHALTDRRFQPPPGPRPTELANRELASSGLSVARPRRPTLGALRPSGSTLSAAEIPGGRIEPFLDVSEASASGAPSGSLSEADLQPRATDPPDILDAKTRLLAEHAVDALKQPERDSLNIPSPSRVAREQLEGNLRASIESMPRVNVPRPGSQLTRHERPGPDASTVLARRRGESLLKSRQPGAVEQMSDLLGLDETGRSILEGLGSVGEAILEPVDPETGLPNLDVIPSVGPRALAKALGRRAPRASKAAEATSAATERKGSSVARNRLRQAAFRKQTEELRKLGEKPVSDISPSTKPALGKPKPAQKPPEAPAAGLRAKTVAAAAAAPQAQRAAQVAAPKAQTLKAAHIPPEATPGKTGFRIPVARLKVAPERFQFKIAEARTATGAGDKLKNVTKWDPAAESTMLAWRDPKTGETFIVDGHHRLDLAKRLGVREIQPTFLDHKIAPTATDARAIAALRNLREGNAAPIDAARFMRDTGSSVSDLRGFGVPTTQTLIRKADNLAQLDNSIFSEVALGRLVEDYGVAAGRVSSDPVVQKKIIEQLVKSEQRTGAKLTAEHAETLANRVALAGQRTETRATLFGDEVTAESLFDQEAELVTFVRGQLAKEKQLFSTVSKTKQAARLREAGNVLSEEANLAIAQRSGEARDVFDRLVNKSGPVNDIIQSKSRELAKGRSASDVRQETLEAVRKAVPEILGGTKAAPQTRFGALKQATLGAPAGDKSELEVLGEKIVREKRAALSKAQEASAQATAQGRDVTDVLIGPRKGLEDAEKFLAEVQSKKPLLGDVRGAASVELLTGGLPALVKGTSGVVRQVLRNLPANKLRAKSELIDRFAPVEEFTRRIQGKSVLGQSPAGPAQKRLGFEQRALSLNEDPFVAARLFAGQQGKVEARLIDLQKALRPAQRDRKALTQHALFERFEELGERGITDFPGGVTLAEIRKGKAELESTLSKAQLANIRQSEEAMRVWSNRLLTEARDAGVISKAGFDAIVTRNQKYVPLQRMGFLDEQLDQLPRGFNSFSVRGQDIVNEIKGSQRDVIDPFESMVRNAYKSVSVVERNKVARKVWNLAERPEFSDLVVRLKGQQAPPPGMGKMSVLIDGTKHEFAVPEAVAGALKGLNDRQVDLVTRVARIGSATLRAGATGLNIAFAPANAIRDFQTAILKSEVGFTALDWMRGLSSSVGKGKLYQEYLDSGAAFSGFLEAESGASLRGFFGFGQPGVKQASRKLFRSRLSDTVRTATNPLAMIRAAAEKLELAPRIGVFARARRLGRPTAEAAFISRNVTVDFARQGSTMRVLNMWVPFLNARLQGTINVAKALKDRPIRSLATVGALVGVPTVATYLHNTRRFPEVWKDIADFEKEINYIVILGDERDDKGNPTNVVKIPKGDVGRVLGNPLENFLHYWEGRDSESLDALALEVLSDISPVSFTRDGEFSLLRVLSDITPPTVKAAVESTTNTNLFTGRKIVPRRLEGASPSEQFRADTPQWAVDAGRFFGVSPLKIMNAIGTQFGGLGRQVAQFPDVGSAAGQITRRFVGARGGAEEQRDFETVEEATRVHTDQGVKARRAAETVIDKLSALPISRRMDAFRKMMSAGDISAEVVDQVNKELERRAAGLTAFERSLKSRPVRIRAEFMIDKLKTMPMLDRGQAVQRWLDKKLLTTAVRSEIDRIMKERAVE